MNWQGPLLALVPIAAVSVFLAPALAILEGAGQRDLIYRFRFVQMVLGSLVVWLALAMGLKLWALVVSSLVQSILAVYVTFFARGSFFREFRSISGHALQLPMDARCLAHAVASRLDQCDVSLRHPVLHDHRIDVS